MKSINRYSIHPRLLPDEKRPAFILALISAFLVTLLGAVYFVFMACLAATGAMTFPPTDSVQLFGGITTAAAAILLPVLFVSNHYLVQQKAKVYSLLGVVFCTLFSAFVGINRFVQLSIVRLSTLEGKTAELSRFLPYDGRSAMFALEMIGWGVFMSLAVFFLALALSRHGFTGAARRTFFVYTPLGLISAIAFILDSPLSVVGFVAWGFVLFLGTGFLMFSLLNYDKHWAANQT